MGKEDRKLQIKLAQLQTDVQMWLAACFGFIALFGSMILGAQQQFFSTPESQTVVKYSFLSTMVIGIIGMIVATWFSTNQMKAKRAEMDKL